MPNSDIIFVLRWWLIFLLLGSTFLPITSKIFSSFLDKGYIFSKIIGLLFITYAVFILGTLHLLKFNEPNIIIIWAIIAIPQFILLRKQKIFEKNDLKLFAVEEFIFLASIFIWTYVKGFNPDIHDLEKFMDYGFINSILRSNYFPPRDMWLTPFSINYYYFGHLFTAVVTQISQIPSYVSFNLMLSTIFAFTFTTSFSIGINLVNKIKRFSLKKIFVLGLFFSYIVSFAGNLQTLYAFFTHYDSEWPKPLWQLKLSIFTFPNSYWYPSATRFIYHTIHEFPSYSFVVADLHGHVLDIPVVMTMIALFLVLTNLKRIPYGIVILFAFLLSIAYMTNAWDGLIYMGLGGVLFFTVNFVQTNGKTIKRLTSAVVKTIKSSILLFFLFFIFSYAFNKSFSPFASGIGLNCSPDFLIKVGKIGPFIFEKGFCQVTPIWELLILYGFFLFMVVSLLIFLRKKQLLSSDIFVVTISLLSFCLIIVPEVIYLKDIYTAHFRANTMFKLSYQSFIMLAISSVYAIIRIVSSLREGKKTNLGRVGYILFVILGLFLLFLVSIYPYFAIPSGYASLKGRKDLNGINYLRSLYPTDYNAISWINKNIKGQPVILEAQGDSYTDFARVSANTGLPTVLGWTVHEWLWRGSYDIPAARFQDISNLYETRDLSLAKQIIKKYNISYIYIGDLERGKYQVNEDKFTKLGKLVYSSNGTNIYRVD
jgi:uncharacterized membrane protein